MWRGLYTAATGMITETKRTDVIANNIANAATTGYKHDKAIHAEFEAMLIRRVHDFDEGGMVGMPDGFTASVNDLGTNNHDVTQIRGFNADPFYIPSIGRLGLGDYIDEIAVDYEQGPLETTGHQFDLAIVGNGFFTIDSPQGVRYTRNGAFFKNSEGYIQDIRGCNLLDVNGNPIRIPRDVLDKDISITGDGSIFVHGDDTELEEPPTNPDNLLTVGNAGNRQLLAQIAFVQFDDRLALQKQGDNLFYQVQDADGNVAQPQQATGEILQGVLEKSNVEIVREMVELIHNHRLYEAGQKSVTTQDTMLDASVNQVGRIGGG